MIDLNLFPPSFGSWQGGDPERDIAVLMSGGVDSSVTAMLLQQGGWNVLGITMKIPVAESCEQPGVCCGGADAALVCHKMGIAHYFLDAQEVFDTCVIEPFRQAYSNGLTPNPCVDCNTHLKFSRVWNFLRSRFGIRHLATGHYARINGSGLYRALDHSRDQSYFLYGVRRNQLSFLHFPLGEMTKTKVRELAADMNLPVAEKADSMELCFAAEDDYRRALDLSAKNLPGPIIDTSGKVLGEHKGIALYTVGQRRGIGLAAGEPYYVTHISPRDNAITIGKRDESYQHEVVADNVNVLVPEKLQSGATLLGKVRSTSEPSACAVEHVDGSSVRVRFEEPVFAPAPGQRLVLYDETDRLVAGGTIFYAEENHPGDN